MELKAELLKPFTKKQRMDFIVEQNHRNGYEIRYVKEEQPVETKSGQTLETTKTVITAIQAWGLTEEEQAEQQAQKEAERIARLSLTRGDVFRGLLQAKQTTRAQLRAMIEAMPEETQEQVVAKELALIDFDEALNFFRGNPLIDALGAQLGITKEQLDKFFDTNDYQELIG